MSSRNRTERVRRTIISALGAGAVLGGMSCASENILPTDPGTSDTESLEARARAGLRLVSIGGGLASTCGVTRRGETYCWGSDFFGEVGNGLPRADTDIPALVAGEQTFTQISVGSHHSCGLTKAGQAYCWGLNGEGAVGNGTTDDLIVAPSPVAGGLTFAQISAGGSHTCGLIVGGQAYCWGWDVSGQLGNGAPLISVSSPSLVAGGLTFKQISSGLIHTCGVTTSGAAYCWGSNTFGEAGNGSFAAGTNVPSRVAGGLTFTQVSAGSAHTCGLTAGGQAYCWGLDNGQLGNGPPLSGSNVPSLVAGRHIWTEVTTGSNHSCGVTTHGEAYCWGIDNFGQLGNGASSADVNVPTLVVGGHKYSQVSAGLFHTCAVSRGRHQAYCWGSNIQGEIGNGTRGGAFDAPTSVSVPGS